MNNSQHDCPSCGQERDWKFLERELCRNASCSEYVPRPVPKPALRTTHTIVKLAVSDAAYNEIRAHLQEANYDHCFLEDGSIDMTGIAVEKEEAA